MSPVELAAAVAERCKARRLALGFSREELAARSGVNTESLKRFERTGRIAFDSLVKLAIALDAVEGFDRLFDKATYASLDDVLQANPTRQRGRRGQRKTV